MSVPFGLSYAVLWILVVLLGLVVLGLARIVHDLHAASGDHVAAPTGFPNSALVGQPAPQIDMVDLAGEKVTIADFAGRESAVLFVSPSCATCVVTLEELDAVASKVDGSLLLVCMAGAEECRRMADQYHLDVRVVADPDEQVSGRFGVDTLPMAVLVSKGGRILSYGRPGRGEELDRMLREEAVEAEEAR